MAEECDSKTIWWVIIGSICGLVVVISGLYLMGQVMHQASHNKPLHEFCKTKPHEDAWKDLYTPELLKLSSQMQLYQSELETIQRKTASGAIRYIFYMTVYGFYAIYYFTLPLIDIFTTFISIDTFCRFNNIQMH